MIRLSLSITAAFLNSSCEHTCTHTSSAYSSPPLKPSDVWRFFAWFRQRARGDKLLHLTSHISCRRIKPEGGRAVATVTYIFCRALCTSIRYWTSPLPLTLDHIWQTSEGQIMYEEHWGGISCNLQQKEQVQMTENQSSKAKSQIMYLLKDKYLQGAKITNVLKVIMTS